MFLKDTRTDEKVEVRYMPWYPLDWPATFIPASFYVWTIWASTGTHDAMDYTYSWLGVQATGQEIFVSLLLLAFFCEAVESAFSGSGILVNGYLSVISTMAMTAYWGDFPETSTTEFQWLLQLAWLELFGSALIYIRTLRVDVHVN